MDYSVDNICAHINVDRTKEIYRALVADSRNNSAVLNFQKNIYMREQRYLENVLLNIQNETKTVEVNPLKNEGGNYGKLLCEKKYVKVFFCLFTIKIQVPQQVIPVDFLFVNNHFTVLLSAALRELR